MKTVAILQARLNSTRLPKKVTLPLAGKSMLWNICERVQRAKKLDVVAVAVPVKDFSVLQFHVPPGVLLCPYEGDENDLVGRYLSVAEHLHTDLIVRVPCDNPCIEPEYIDKAIGYWFEGFTPFISNTTAGCNGTWVDGIGAEVFSFNRLQWLDQFTKERPNHPELREHIHQAMTLSMDKADIRLDINTRADYEFIKEIYDHFGHNRFHVSEVLAYLSTKENTNGQSSGHHLQHQLERPTSLHQ